jgi:predicted nuclease of predicted toxin-antitoxin system
MKLLLDENISYRVAKKLRDIFEIDHVSQFNLLNSNDKDIWTFALKYNYTIVTNDSDFNEFSVINGFPPKVIWLRSGNRRTDHIVNVLKNNELLIENFVSDKHNGVLIING